MTAHIEVRATSRAEEAGLLALLDLSQVIDDWERYRVIGGHMVGIHLALADLPDLRGTKEADLAAPTNVLGDPTAAPSRLVHSRGYDKVDGSRIARASESGDVAIDLIGPSDKSGARHNRPVGMFSVDEFPAIRFCLRRPPLMVMTRTLSTEGAHMGEGLIAVPDVAAAIVLKACAGRPSDRADTWLLVEAAAAQPASLTEADCENIDAHRAAQLLHHRWAVEHSQRRRLALHRVVWRPPAPVAFRDP